MCGYEQGIAAEDAVYLPAVETALSLVHDVHPRVGESVAVFGQGMIGLEHRPFLLLVFFPIAPPRPPSCRMHFKVGNLCSLFVSACKGSGIPTHTIFPNRHTMPVCGRK